MSMIDDARQWLADQRGYYCSICRKGKWAKEAAGNIPSDLVLYHREAGVVHPDFDLVNASVHDIQLRCERCAQYQGITVDAFIPKIETKTNMARWTGGSWMTDGDRNVLVKAGQVEAYESRGFYKGRTLKKVFLENHKGKKRITNGVENRIVDPSIELPEGWWFGRAKKMV